MFRYTYTQDFVNCPECGSKCRRHNIATRCPIAPGGKRAYRIGNYKCYTCDRFFIHPAYIEEVTGKKNARYTRAMKSIMIEQLKTGKTLRKISDDIFVLTGIRVPTTTLHDLNVELLEAETEAEYNGGGAPGEGEQSC